MLPFKSFVILDLESSGLPAFGGKTKITELSFIGVLTDHLLESHRKSESAPRVLQKLSLCFYPQKRIDFEATEITGLDNFLLEEIPAFNNEACDIVASFLSRMPSPLCLIAHNGMKFDFQLLKSELAAKKKELPDDIFCADSILAYRTIFPATSQKFATSPGLISPVRNTISSDPVTPPKPVQLISNGSDLECSKINSELPSVSEFKKTNETTPKHSVRQECPPLKRKNADNENGDSQGKIVRKKLFKGQGKPDSYKLVDLYSHIHGKGPEYGHRAESDSMSLLECVVATAPEFLSWVENNSLPFKRIPCMW
ncbi:uncharacterized protein LOC117653498 [Thrips palmi]|uniref:Uncharacterized protein LOC117653498 n=1 Tax=Thrips palmi TaxID=161013 RepID=A0A6P9AAJ4_THRPL|nr:uncharacterized protein LOC117653498 [Thrips palmi]